jgi:hypothetical protein
LASHLDESEYGAESLYEDEFSFEVESTYEYALEPKFDPGVMKNPEKAAFSCFPKLAAELRIRVWKEACQVTRNIDIAVGSISVTFAKEDGVGARPHYYRSRCPPPSVLHVSREARDEGLKYYKLEFGVTYNIPIGDRTMPELAVSAPPRIYINPQKDRLCVMLPLYIDISENHFRRRREINQKCYDIGLRRLEIGVEWYEAYFWPLVYYDSVLEEIVFFGGREVYESRLVQGTDQGFGFEEDLRRWSDGATKFSEECVWEAIDEKLPKRRNVSCLTD